ncbi:hypothetical protein HDE_03659 [Halotydeus destructor]|nr:hypothetical protein HDE_03659 [Halotydeus destructor]
MMVSCFSLTLMAVYAGTVMADNMDDDLDILGYIFELLGVGLHLVSGLMDSDDDGSQGRLSSAAQATLAGGGLGRR